MRLNGKRVLITGASGGIGRALVAALLDECANVVLSGRDPVALQMLVAHLGVSRERALVVACDLAKAADRARLSDVATTWQGGIDVLINNAGVSHFGLLEEQDQEVLDRALATNLLAPMDLCRRLLPHLTSRPSARIVNIGSVFGSIGFPGNTVYCGTKFGLRGFSEALGRELADSNVRVHYFAPRATRTSFNASAVDELNHALGNAVDEPETVARQIVSALLRDRQEMVFGWPEKLFARINAVWPRIVDRALRKQLPIIRHFAHSTERNELDTDQQTSRKVG